MDKLIHDDRGNVTISNDGATIMRLLEVVHPAASLLVDVARSQDAEAGDGTTTVVLLAGELLRAVKPFVEDGAPPRAVARALRAAGALACARLRELAVPIGGGKDGAEKREMLIKCASTSLNSKLVCGEKEFFAAMVVDAVSTLDQRTLDLSMLGVKKVVGGKGREREREREGREREREFFFAFSRGLAGGERKSATHKKVEREETERERNETHSHPPHSPPPPPTHSLSLSRRPPRLLPGRRRRLPQDLLLRGLRDAAQEIRKPAGFGFEHRARAQGREGQRRGQAERPWGLPGRRGRGVVRS